LRGRVCVYGNPTVDVIVTSRGVAVRTGGGVYYTALSLLDEGVKPEVYSVGPHWLFLVNGLMEFKVNPSYSTSSMVFRITYLDTERVMEVAEMSPQLSSVDEHSGLCYTVVNPVLGEVTPSLLKSLRIKSIVLAGDVQGFVRERRLGPLALRGSRDVRELVGVFDVLHMDAAELLALTASSSKDEALGKLRKLLRDGYVVVTEGFKPPVVVHREGFEVVGRERVRVGDKTGSGDYFLARLFVGVVEGLPVKEAVEYALEETDKWLLERDRR
jgi:hypothetical protein